MDKLATIRPYRLGQDTEEVCQLEAAAFTEDYRRKGEDPRLESRRESRMETMIMWIARVIPSMRFTRLGFVIEKDHRLASVVLFSRDGLKGTRWSIDAVGTHPDSQRQGMAKRLLKRVFSSIRSHGGTTCTLKVRQDNEIAYRLYQGLAFSHFHTSRQMRRAGASSLDVEMPQIDGLSYIDLPSWYSLWRERKDLAKRSTPVAVQEYKPIVEGDFRRSWLIRTLAPLAMKFGGFKLDQWAVRKEGRLVATLRTRADLTGNRSHEIRLSIDPEWHNQLSSPLLQIACQRLEQAPSKGMLVEVAGEEGALIDALETLGFEDMSVWHWLGVSVERALGAFENEKNQPGVLTT